MELTRRDALIALGAMGFAVGSAATRSDPPENRSQDVVAGVTAVSEVVFPSAVSGNDRFVDAYVQGRLEEDAAYQHAVPPLLASLDRDARRTTGTAFASLAVERRDDLLRESGAANAYPDPEGTVPQRVRYYLINDLLYALYTSPTGGELVGNENPIGHPGGRRAYQRGPEDE